MINSLNMTLWGPAFPECRIKTDTRTDGVRSVRTCWRIYWVLEMQAQALNWMDRCFELKLEGGEGRQTDKGGSAAWFCPLSLLIPRRAMLNTPGLMRIYGRKIRVRDLNLLGATGRPCVVAAIHPLLELWREERMVKDLLLRYVAGFEN